MNVKLTSWTLERKTPCPAAAWADLRLSGDRWAEDVPLECSMVSSVDEDVNLLHALLRSAPSQGLRYRAQCRVGHRPESPSKVRLHKGLFGESGRRTGAESIERVVSQGQVTLIGVWVLSDFLLDNASEACLDHSTCCFVLSSEPLLTPLLLDSLRASVVTRGACSINYPDLAEAVCPLGHIIMKAHPVNRQNVLVLGEQGAMQRLRGWIELSVSDRHKGATSGSA